MKVKIGRDTFSDSLFILFYYNQNGKRYIAEPIKLKFKEADEYPCGTKPTIALNYYDAQELLKEMAEELDKQGVKTENDFKIQGLLEATKFHLSDLRHLLKLDIKEQTDE